ncbi:MAG: S66 peptidase family protein [Patescibacteria group bacterium]
MYPKKLEKGDEVRIVAPSRSLGIISEGAREIANRRFAELGLSLSFGKHVEEKDEFLSSSIESRVTDLHEAFLDSNVKAIFTVIGGFNCNQILGYLNWDIINKNPKMFCGYSDITALSNAIFAKTGLVSYSGPHYSTLGQELYFDYTLEYFEKCLFSVAPFEVFPSKEWSDDRWYEDQSARQCIQNPGFLVINEGGASGRMLGGNLCTFNLLHGTEYFPDLNGSVLFLEDDWESLPHTFDRNLQSLLHLPGFSGVRGIVIGRFQKASKMSDALLVKIIKTKRELNGLPVLANVDFGHTDPKITFPIGGEARMEVGRGVAQLVIIRH